MTRRSQLQRFAFSVLLLAFFIVVLYSTSRFSLRVAGYFPGFAALVGVTTVVILVAVEARRLLLTRSSGSVPEGVQSAAGATDGEGLEIDSGGVRRVLLWIVVAVTAVALLGLLAGAGVFLVLFLRFEGRESWVYTIVAVGVAVGLLFGVGNLFSLQWPESVVTLLTD